MCEFYSVFECVYCQSNRTHNLQLLKKEKKAKKPNNFDIFVMLSVFFLSADKKMT